MRLPLAAALACLALAPSLAFAGDDFFLIDNANFGFFKSNTTAVGADVLVAQEAQGFWGDLTPSNAPGHLFATLVTAQQVVTIRTSDGAITSTLSIDREARSLAYDVAGDVLFGLPQTGPVELFTIDRATGVTTVVGDTAIPDGVINTVALAFDPYTGMLFAATTLGNLFMIDPATAASVLMGNFGLGAPFGLAFNPGDGHLYLVDATTDHVYLLRRGNAAIQSIGGPLTGATFATGLAFSTPGPAPAAGDPPPARSQVGAARGAGEAGTAARDDRARLDPQRVP